MVKCSRDMDMLKKSKTLHDIAAIEKSQFFLLFENEASCEDFSCPRVF